MGFRLDAPFSRCPNELFALATATGLMISARKRDALAREHRLKTGNNLRIMPITARFAI
jgi:hypothetical protein